MLINFWVFLVPFAGRIISQPGSLCANSTVESICDIIDFAKVGVSLVDEKLNNVSPSLSNFFNGIRPRITPKSIENMLTIADRINTPSVDSNLSNGNNSSLSSLESSVSRRSLSADITFASSIESNENAAQVYYEIAGSPKNAFYLIEYDGFQIRGRTDGQGGIRATIPQNTEYTLSVYDPDLNIIGEYSGSTAGSGSPSTVPSLNLVSVAGLPDSDGDQLVDRAEEIIGTNQTQTDTDNDGISDLAEIEQGLDPLGDRGFPTGVISSIPLEGKAREIVIEGSTLDTGNQTAYIATGSHGLAVVDTSDFDNPIVLGQLDLEGNNIDIAVDNDLQTVAIASQNGGLHLVDVSDPMLPTLYGYRNG